MYNGNEFPLQKNYIKIVSIHLNIHFCQHFNFKHL